MPYYEDYEVGQKRVSPSRTVTDAMATILIDLAGYVEPQFTDELAASETPLGWRALPGRIVFALMGGLGARMEGSRTPGAALAVAVDGLTWRNPVKVGDTVHIEWEVIEARRTSNPKWGLVRNREVLLNHKGEPCCEAEVTHLFEYAPSHAAHNG